MQTLLTIDIGNSSAKGYLFRDGSLIGKIKVQSDCLHEFLSYASRQNATGVAICSVAESAEDLAAAMRRRLGIPVVVLDRTALLPLDTSEYDRSRLGADRLAAAAGALAINPGNSLVIDAGTALTVDLVADSKFLGGNISPGVSMRLDSLHAFTSRLPQVAPCGETPLLGHDTETAIRAGVIGGICAEISNIYTNLERRYAPLIPIITGGDAQILSRYLQDHGIECVESPALTGIGLASVFAHNIHMAFQN